MADLFGTSKDDLVRKHDDEVHADEDELAGYASADRVVIDERKTVVLKESFTRTDGRIAWFQTTKVPLVLDDGSVHVLGIARDITEQRHFQEALLQRERQLTERERELEELAYVSSHDLQEPLRKIRLFGERLERRAAGHLDERGRHFLGRIMDASTRMHRLIDDLLTLSRVHRGVDLAIGPCDPNALMASVARDLEVMIEEAGAQLSVEHLPPLEADGTQLRRLLQNLVSNAIKYRRRDVPPRVDVRAWLLDEKGRPVPEGSTCARAWRLAVEDNGIGFEPAYAERIFGMFQRLHGRAEYAGSGIGLAVCRRVAGLHGGTIEAAGRPGEGATFTVTLPLRQEHRHAEAAAREEMGPG